MLATVQEEMEPEAPSMTNPVLQRSVGAARLTTKLAESTTRVENLFQSGCAKIRLPRLSGSDLQAVMINSSGGMTGGDKLSWTFSAEARNQLTVTSQACERIYASRAEAWDEIDPSYTNVTLKLEAEASVNWLPQETIVFDRGSLKRTIDVDMKCSSELLMIEPLIFGRSAMDEVVTRGQVHDRWRIRRNGVLVHAEDLRLSGDIHRTLQNNAVAGGNVAMATVLLVAPRAEQLLSQTIEIISEAGSASFWNGKLLARMFAPNGYELRKILTPLVQTLNQGQALPKVWAL